MKAPGFVAVYSLYPTSRHYRPAQEIRGGGGQFAGVLVPHALLRPGLGGELSNGPGGRVIGFEPGEPGAAYASISVECSNGKDYSLSTGNKKGSCSPDIRDGKVTGAYCIDSKGNIGVSMDCNAGCTKSEGTGSCKFLAKS